MTSLTSKDRPEPSPAKMAGLDVGSALIKLMEVSVEGTAKPVISAIGYSDSRGLSGADLILPLKNLIEEASLSSKEVTISVSGPQVIERFMKMPKMRDDELASAIRFEAERFVPFNIDECVIDYHLMHQDEKDGRMGLMVAIAKKTFIADCVKTVEGSGLNIKAVDVDCFALSNAFTIKKSDEAEADKTVSVVNIGYSRTNLCIIRKGSLYFARDITFGMAHLIETASIKAGAELKSLEDIAKLSGEQSSKGIGGAKQALVDITDEIKLSFGYYENQVGRSIDEIYVTGGGSYISQMQEVFQDAFSQNPTLWNPLENFDFKSPDAAQRYAPQARAFAVCAGLALR